ncbi:MAG: hypothetical protein WBC70_14890 [Candidatus Aminicenantales bacterium]
MLATPDRQTTGSKKMTIIVEAMKIRPEAESASINAHTPNKKPIPMPMAW